MIRVGGGEWWIATRIVSETHREEGEEGVYDMRTRDELRSWKMMI